MSHTTPAKSDLEKTMIKIIKASEADDIFPLKNALITNEELSHACW